MESITKIVILGGGYGGVETAKLLNHHFRKNKTIQISLIDRNPYHTLMTELHEIAGSRTEPEAVQISYKRIFAGSAVNVITDEIQSIDFDGKSLKSVDSSYEYDYLVLGTGGNPEFFGTAGVQENSFTLWSLEDAIRIREHIEIRFREAAKEPNAHARKHDLTFAIAGAGFTGIELAGELIERADVLCQKYHIDRDEVRIIIIEAKESILPILEKKPQKAAMRHLLRKKAEVMLNAPIVKAEEGEIHLKDGTVIRAGTFVWTCGIQASEFTAKISLTKGRVSNDKCSVASPEGIHGMAGCHFDDDDRYIVGERGRVLVNEYMQSVDHKNVFLTGDMLWYVYEEKVVPQIVENALQTAHTVGKNIIAAIEGKPFEAHSPNYHGFLVSIGSKYAVAHIMGISLYGFVAMGMKHVVNLHYLWGVAGFNACWGYLQEEFFQVRHHRSMVGGHLSAKVPAYWSLPLRLWLGLMWVVEGANKFLEGWFDFSAGSKSGWMFSPDVVQAGLDATAGASEAAPSAAAQVADATAAATAAPGATDAVATAFKFNLESTILPPDSPVVTWFRQTFMDGIFAHISYQIFQVAIVSTEVALGLALLGGLFTWPAAVASIGMCIVFTLSGLFAWNQLFYVFAAIVMLGGAGQVAGLDYWVMPWLRKRWNGNRLVQRLHLYADEPVIKHKKA